MAHETTRGGLSRLYVLFPFLDKRPDPLPVLKTETSNGDVENGAMLSQPVIVAPSSSAISLHDKYVIVYDFSQVGKHPEPRAAS